MSVEALGAELRRIHASLPMSLLAQAVEAVDQGCAVLGHVSHGSQSADLHQARAQLDVAKRHLCEAIQAITEVRRIIDSYVATLGAGGAAPSTVGVPLSPVVQRGSPPSSGTGHGGRVGAIIAGLPPQVPKPNPEGKKTHGRLLHGDTSEPMISGRDEDSAEAWRLLKAAGMPAAREPAATTHVEIKAAARISRTGQRHAEVAINNVPCRGIFGCDALLPVILPEGYSLTVHGPNFRKTFTGGRTWSS